MTDTISCLGMCYNRYHSVAILPATLLTLIILNLVVSTYGNIVDLDQLAS